MLTLGDLTELLARYAEGALPLAALQARLLPLIAADPLGVARPDSGPWDAAPDEARLLWRLVYLFDTLETDGPAERRLAARLVRCVESTASATDTFELLPLLIDQERLLVILERHRAGPISRTGFLSVVAESGYAPHVKLWLERAGPQALERLAARLEAGEYDEVMRAFERAPE